MRCKDCSQVRGYAYKRSHLVALRQRRISASDPPSTWWLGERLTHVKRCTVETTVCAQSRLRLGLSRDVAWYNMIILQYPSSGALEAISSSLGNSSGSAR